jgi:SAM-dependent methyltransferase
MGEAYAYGERWDVFCALPPDPKAILDVGCGSGMGFQSYRNRGTRLVGVDIFPSAVEASAERMDEALVLDIETQPWPERFLGTFDVVAFCDSIEHLVDPWRVLRDARPLLRDGGVVVASIPNIRQWRLITKLALGKWDYVQGAGTIQRGHLRFFTRQTVIDLFREAGYHQPRFYFSRSTFHLRRPEHLLDRLTAGKLPDLWYGTYTVAATPRRDVTG